MWQFTTTLIPDERPLRYKGRGSRETTTLHQRFFDAQEFCLSCRISNSPVFHNPTYTETAQGAGYGPTHLLEQRN